MLCSELEAETKQTVKSHTQLKVQYNELGTSCLPVQLKDTAIVPFHVICDTALIFCTLNCIPSSS